MENEKDWFTEGWAEDGGVVSDERETEEMPEEAEDGGAPERVSGDVGPYGGAENASVSEETAQTRVSGDEPLAGQRAAGSVTPNADRRADLVRFVTEYPGVDAKSIPRSVWRKAAEGESIVTAYAKYEAETLREENRRLRQTENNRRRSAGSQTGVGAGARRFDAFESGWEDAY